MRCCRKKSAVQGIHGCLGVINVDLLDVSNLAQTGDLGVDAVKAASGVELAQPRILVRTGHIIVGVVTGNDHQRAQDDLGITSFLDFLDDSLTGGILRLALNGADEDIVIAQGLHGGLHLAVADLGGVGSAMAHEHESGAIGGSSRGILITGGLDGLGGNGGGYGFLILVDDGGISANLAQQGLGDEVR